MNMDRLNKHLKLVKNLLQIKVSIDIYFFTSPIKQHNCVIEGLQEVCVG